ncbi:MAG: DegQ family serine endoprotease [Proteobacteria bacterium]|nr:DegQ family serine endoprotease [Pseudomonadota bacterium]
MNRYAQPGVSPVLTRALALCTLAVAVAACSRDLSAQSSRPAAGAAPAAVAAPQAGPSGSPDGVAGAGMVLPDFTGLVERLGPAVVNVEVTQKARAAGRAAPGLSPDDPFYDFFRRFGIPAPQQQPRDAEPVRAAGSGFIVSADGYILTNTHVVANADTVSVRLTDRREFVARVIGADERTDVAVIHINAGGLPYVKLGDPSQLKPGQWVLAIGSPFGFENSATAGIISATSRAVPGENYVPFIQTDVAVNPGNSGGPLFNMAGEVIGINSQIFSRTGGFMGVSFAIPIDVARNVEEQLIRTGRVVRGRIGVTIQDVNAQLAESFGLDRPHGALVSSVEPDGPAAKAGIAAGDVILTVAGHPIEHYGELSGVIAALKPGSPAELSVWRGGKARDVRVVIEQAKESAQVAAADAGARAAPAQRARQSAVLGLTVRSLEPAEQQQAGVPGGLVVERVGGAAQQADVQPGDLILGVNGRRVTSVAQFEAAARSAGKNVALLIQRDGAQIFIPLRLP